MGLERWKWRPYDDKQLHRLVYKFILLSSPDMFFQASLVLSPTTQGNTLEAENDILATVSHNIMKHVPTYTHTL